VGYIPSPREAPWPPAPSCRDWKSPGPDPVAALISLASVAKPVPRQRSSGYLARSQRPLSRSPWVRDPSARSAHRACPSPRAIYPMPSQRGGPQGWDFRHRCDRQGSDRLDLHSGGTWELPVVTLDVGSLGSAIRSGCQQDRKTLSSGADRPAANTAQRASSTGSSSGRPFLQGSPQGSWRSPATRCARPPRLPSRVRRAAASRPALPRAAR
jgi:hypothetical protein